MEFGSFTTWSWNRAFLAGCDVKPTTRCPAGDVCIHNSEGLELQDYLPLAALHPLPRLVYVGTCALPVFVHDVLPRIASPFVLCTGMSDPGPAAVLGSCAAAHALASHPLLVAWFAEMRDFPPCAPEARCGACAKTRALPIGVDLHTLAFRAGDRPGWGPGAPPREQAAAFASAAAAAAAADAAGTPRLPTCYVHFGWRPPPRREALKLLKTNTLFHVEQERSVERGELWARMARHRWVLCLQGGGPDCHRTWEALGLGCGVVCEALPLLVELLGGGGEGGGGGRAEGGAGACPGGGGAQQPPLPQVLQVQLPAQASGSGSPAALSLSFVPGLPVAAVFAPPVTGLLSRDPQARAAAREGWREGALSASRLEAEWCRVEAARAPARAAAAAGGGSAPILLPALLSSEFWIMAMRAEVGAPRL
jgi:hypothetical protein